MMWVLFRRNNEVLVNTLTFHQKIYRYNMQGLKGKGRRLEPINLFNNFKSNGNHKNKNLETWSVCTVITGKWPYLDLRSSWSRTERMTGFGSKLSLKRFICFVLIGCSLLAFCGLRPVTYSINILTKASSGGSPPSKHILVTISTKKVLHRCRSLSTLSIVSLKDIVG